MTIHKDNGGFIKKNPKSTALEKSLKESLIILPLKYKLIQQQMSSRIQVTISQKRMKKIIGNWNNCWKQFVSWRN